MADRPSAETLTVKLPIDLCAREIEKRGFFGWTFQKEGSTYNPDRWLDKHLVLSRKRKLVFTRPADLFGKERLDELMDEWERREESLLTYSKADPFLAIFLFILLVIPGIIYVVYKSHRKRVVKETNLEIREKQKDLVAEAERILKGGESTPAPRRDDGPRPQASVPLNSAPKGLSRSPSRSNEK